jgi:hypothetical protein
MHCIWFSCHYSSILVVNLQSVVITTQCQLVDAVQLFICKGTLAMDSMCGDCSQNNASHLPALTIVELLWPDMCPSLAAQSNVLGNTYER